ncbi:MAG TPA: OmpH family outer membrane protein [Rudaea sp.]|nr:OmpH family outer membrane protein [Rudaea sp.]
MKRSAGGRWQIGALLLALASPLHVLVAQPAPPAQASKVGYIDYKRLLDNAPQTIEMRAKLEREFAPRDAALKADESKLATLKQRYERDGPIMSKADGDALKREIDALDRSIKRTREDLRTELNARAATERDRIWQQLMDSVIEYARAQGYDLVVPSPVIYASPRIDITDAVLDKLRHAKPAGESP